MIKGGPGTARTPCRLLCSLPPGLSKDWPNLLEAGQPVVGSQPSLCFASVHPIPLLLTGVDSALLSSSSCSHRPWGLSLGSMGDFSRCRELPNSWRVKLRSPLPPARTLPFSEFLGAHRVPGRHRLIRVFYSRWSHGIVASPLLHIPTGFPQLDFYRQFSWF